MGIFKRAVVWVWQGWRGGTPKSSSTGGAAGDVEGDHQKPLKNGGSNGATEPVGSNGSNGSGKPPGSQERPDLADACKRKRWAEVPALIEQGADVNAWDPLGKGTPLHWASWFGHAPTVKILLDSKADVNTASKAGAFAPHLAARGGQIASLDKLWRHDPSLICRKDGNGRTPLHCAALEGVPASVEWLYLHGAGVNSLDAIGATPLHWSSHDGRVLVSHLLLNYNVSNSERDSANHRTPLHLLALKSRWSLLESALNLRPDAYGGPEVYEIKEMDGHQPKDLVPKWGCCFRWQIRAFALWLRCRQRAHARQRSRWCLAFRPRIVNTAMVIPLYHFVHDVVFLCLALPLLVTYNLLYTPIVCTMVIGASMQAVSIFYWFRASTGNPGYCDATRRFEADSMGPDRHERSIQGVLQELNEKSLERYGPPRKKKSRSKSETEEAEKEEWQVPEDPAQLQELDDAIVEIKRRLGQCLQDASVDRLQPYEEDYKALVCSDDPASNSKDWGRRACTVCGRIRTQRSKHCKDCGRCVARFDHHCPWIGNCVGAGNVFDFAKFVGFTGLSLVISEVLCFFMELALEFRFPFVCAGMLVMSAVDCVCILFTVMLLGRQVVLASSDMTEYEASVLNLSRRRRKRITWIQAIRNVFWFFFNHRMFLASLSTEGPYPEQDRPDTSINDVENVNGHTILADASTKRANVSVARPWAAHNGFLFSNCRRRKDPKAQE